MSYKRFCQTNKTVSLLVLLIVIQGLLSTTKCEPFSILTYNIQHGAGMDSKFNLTRQVATMREANADFITLQEVDNTTRRASRIDELEYFSNELSMKYYRFAKFRDFDDGGYGVGILSRFPILETKIFNYHAPSGDNAICAVPAPHDFCQGAIAVRVAVYCTQIWILTTHLTTDTTDSVIEAKQLVSEFVETIRKESRPFTPVIITGDFNSEPNSPAISQLLNKTSQFHDAWSSCASAKDEGFTFSSAAPTKRIDYQFFDYQTLKCTDATLLNSTASDHLPLKVSYTFADAKLENQC